MALPDARIQLHLTQPSSSYIGHMSHRRHVSLISSGQASAYIYLILNKQIQKHLSSCPSSCRFLSKDWQEKFLTTAAEAVFSDLGSSLSVEQYCPSFLRALAVSKRVHLSPQYVTSSSSSCLSNASPPTHPHYLLLCTPPAGLVLVSVVPRNGWSTFDWAPEGTCCYLTHGAGFWHCHAFALANVRVCLLWQLEMPGAGTV